MHVLFKQLREVEGAYSDMIRNLGLSDGVGRILGDVIACRMNVLPSDLGCVFGFDDGSVIGHYMLTDLQKDLVNASFASGLRKQVV